MWDVCFYSWLMKCDICVMFYSDKFLSKQLLLEQYFHLFSFFFFPSPSVSFSDNGSGSGEGGEYQTPLIFGFDLSFKLMCTSFIQIRMASIYHMNWGEIVALKISFKLAVLSHNGTGRGISCSVHFTDIVLSDLTNTIFHLLPAMWYNI